MKSKHYIYLLATLTINSLVFSQEGFTIQDMNNDFQKIAAILQDANNAFYNCSQQNVLSNKLAEGKIQFNERINYYKSRRENFNDSNDYFELSIFSIEEKIES